MIPVIVVHESEHRATLQRPFAIVRVHRWGSGIGDVFACLS